MPEAPIPEIFRTFHAPAKTVRAANAILAHMFWSQYRRPFAGSPCPALPTAQRLWLGTCRRACGWLALMASLGLLLLPANAESPDRWRTYPSVGLLEGVALRIHWFNSSKELREAAKNSGQDIEALGLYGYAILKRNTQTGEYVCDLYVVKMTGALVDDDRTKTFGHEVLHCFGLRHD